ncbi:sugar O-acetyltransferase [Anaerofustis butyriciformans]|uniref:sugar O-acetyltransferase n=1 Tax=Anaerofustis butyriciformans TaxID=3108533 RepID=UPI003F8C3A2F
MDLMEILKNKQGYNSNHSNELAKIQQKSKMLCFEYNNTSPIEEDKRKEILKNLLGTYNPLVFIEPSFHCDYGFNIHMHGLAVINYNCVILDTSPVNIGKNAFIAPGVCIACSGHAIDKTQRAKGVGTSKPITIEDDVWIGANSTICAGVTIGQGSVIATGSVVNKDIPKGAIAGGVPCKVIRNITKDDIIENIIF